MQSKIVKCKTMEEAFNIIKSYPLIGNFMAYQLVTDINYSEVVNWKEDEFTVAKRIGNRPLQLIDCQNIFCELNKYCRKALPELKSNRTKIKKRYIQKGEKINYIYPPKWKIN